MNSKTLTVYTSDQSVLCSLQSEQCNLNETEVITSTIFCYLLGDFKTIKHAPSDTCLDVCNTLCEKLGIDPVSRLLFGLRINGTVNWLLGCRTLQSTVSYDFRLRFKVSKKNIIKLDLSKYFIPNKDSKIFNHEIGRHSSLQLFLFSNSERCVG
jgi:hypothetical protein